MIYRTAKQHQRLFYVFTSFFFFLVTSFCVFTLIYYTVNQRCLDELPTLRLYSPKSPSTLSPLLPIFPFWILLE
jgi:hypothetical protein